MFWPHAQQSDSRSLYTLWKHDLVTFIWAHILLPLLHCCWPHAGAAMKWLYDFKCFVVWVHSTQGKPLWYTVSRAALSITYAGICWKIGNQQQWMMCTLDTSIQKIGNRKKNYILCKFVCNRFYSLKYIWKYSSVDWCMLLKLIHVSVTVS